MSYSIRIGEQVLGTRADDVHGVHYAERDGAPRFDGDAFTGPTNERAIDYSDWASFCERVGLHRLFFHPETGLMRHHPGCEPLMFEHAAIVEGVMEIWRENHPSTIPGWAEGQDPDLARVIWLAWWMCWAIETCEHPALSNR